MNLATQELCDRIDGLSQVVAFLGEAMCAPREEEFSDAALAGARKVFTRAQSALEEVRQHCILLNSE